ncbi:unnamed protein product [Diamesa tonsa]
MINFFRRFKLVSQRLIKKSFSEKYLLLTNCAISISLSSVGDCIEQQYEIYKKEQDQFDKRRNFNMATSGMVVGVFCHHWYKILDRRMPGRTFQNVIKKVLIDQAIASPIVIFLFFATLGVMRKESIQETAQEIKNKALRLYTAEWIVWPPAQIINFYLLPNKYRVLYDNTISLGYDVYTSAVINEPKQLANPSQKLLTTHSFYNHHQHQLNQQQQQRNQNHS